MAPFEAVIFDMDGVLIDSEPLHFAVLSDLLARAGHTLTRAENEQVIGTTSETMFSPLIARHGLSGTVAEYIARYDEMVLGVLHQPHAAAPGVAALMARLRELGKRLAGASSSRRPRVGATIQSLGLAGSFDVVVTGDDVERGKPDPAIYLLTAQRLGVNPDRCIAIE